MTKTLELELQEWANLNEPDLTKLLYASGYWEQIMFVRDRLSPLLRSSYEDDVANAVMVVGTHMSKSVLLPVFNINVPGSLDIRIRYNFYNWAISVRSEHPIPDNFMGLLGSNEDMLFPCYFEGFSEDWVFGSYEKNSSSFSLFLDNEYQLYMFVYLIAHSLRER